MARLPLLFVLVEELQDCTSGIEVISRLGIGDLGNESCLGGRDGVPVNASEERMCLDFFGTISP